jgi:hypothetical protein
MSPLPSSRAETDLIGTRTLAAFCKPKVCVWASDKNEPAVRLGLPAEPLTS